MSPKRVWAHNPCGVSGAIGKAPWGRIPAKFYTGFELTKTCTHTHYFLSLARDITFGLNSSYHHISICTLIFIDTTVKYHYQ